jgi:hypothetical protein
MHFAALAIPFFVTRTLNGNKKGLTTDERSTTLACNKIVALLPAGQPAPGIKNNVPVVSQRRVPWNLFPVTSKDNDVHRE